MYTTVDASGSLGPTVYFLGYIVIVLLMFSNVFIGLVVDRFQVTAIVCLLGGPTTKQGTLAPLTVLYNLCFAAGFGATEEQGPGGQGDHGAGGQDAHAAGGYCCSATAHLPSRCGP